MFDSVCSSTFNTGLKSSLEDRDRIEISHSEFSGISGVLDKFLWNIVSSILFYKLSLHVPLEYFEKLTKLQQFFGDFSVSRTISYRTYTDQI